MADERLELIQQDTGPDPRLAVIWLHGLGADGHDFEPIVPELGLSAASPIRFIFPHAPVRPVTINGGMPMRAWYDIAEMDLSARVDEAGIEQSATQLRHLIRDTTISGFPPQRIVLAGFSQGGVIAVHTGLQYPERLAGIVALSTYVALPDTIEFGASDANRGLPIFMAHGLSDPVIPRSLGKRSMDFLSKRHYAVQWHEYPMEHSVAPAEIRDLSAWLQALIDE